jgi:hypothetical protein
MFDVAVFTVRPLLRELYYWPKFCCFHMPSYCISKHSSLVWCVAMYFWNTGMTVLKKPAASICRVEEGLRATRPLTQSPYLSAPGKPREGASRLPFCLWSVAVFRSLQLEGSSQAVQEESREQAPALQTITMFNNKCRKSSNKYM